MAISLEELKRQRAQIQQHLEWLNAQIRAQEAPRENAQSDASEDVIPIAVGAEPPERPKEESGAASALPEPQIDEPTYKAQTHGELLRARIGCLLFFAFATLLFLFLLFGLPYLL